MELFIGIIAVLVAGLIYMVSANISARFKLRRQHIECLHRLDDVVRVSLPPDAGEMVSAAINEELDEV